MNFCKQCGIALNSRSFCPGCGTKSEHAFIEDIPESSSFCKTCGERILSSEDHICLEVFDPVNNTDSSDEQENASQPVKASLPSSTSFCKLCGQTNSPGHNCTPAPIHVETSRINEGKRKPHFLVTVCLWLIFLSGSAAGAWYYIQQQSNPEKASTPFIKALKENDASALAKLTANADTHVSLTESEAKTLTEQLKQSPDILNKVYQNLENQEKQLLKNSRTEPFIFEIQKVKEKKWKVIDQYEIVVHPVTFAVTVDKDASLFIDGKEVKTNSEGRIDFKNKLPGTFDMKAEKSNSFGSFETEKTIDVWQSANENFALNFTQKYVTVQVAERGMDLYVNDEIYATDIQEKQVKIGPLPADIELTLLGEIHYPWGTLVSNTALAKPDETVSLQFQKQNTSVHQDVYQSIFEFNKSYVDAITYLDTSYLENVENPKLSETVKIIEDLQRRNTYYAGDIVSFIFDASATKVSENDGQYYAEVAVQENYRSVWVAADADEEPLPVSKTYYFIYQMRYSDENESWYVYKTTEKKHLTIANPVVINR